MATEKGIKSAITSHIKKSMGSKNPQLNKWYVGITNNVGVRQAQHKAKLGSILYWKTMEAENMKLANNVERYFSDKGTLNAPQAGGATKSSKHVYVFKFPPLHLNSKGLNGTFDLDEFIKNIFKKT